MKRITARECLRGKKRRKEKKKPRSQENDGEYRYVIAKRIWACLILTVDYFKNSKTTII